MAALRLLLLEKSAAGVDGDGRGCNIADIVLSKCVRINMKSNG